ncbi:MAG: PrsW family glutamic-type intramembrane protease [Anaerolineales bacterium]|nr:PrsW family glutamic-type intramembrane protease [Anaerolineales bacterium]
MQTNKTHWPSLSILIVLGLSVAFALLIALGLGASSIMDLFTGDGDPAGQMIGVFAFGFESLILLTCSWFVLQKTLGREQAETPFNFPFADWQAIPIIGMVIVSVAIGGVVAYTEIAWLAWIMLPVLTVLVIVPPIWLLFGIGTKGIELGARWRIFGMFGLSMTIAPLIMVVMEGVLLLGIIIVGVVVIAVQQPALFQELVNLGRIIKQETDQEVILKLLAPYISNPVVIATAVGYIALAVPLIEELFKPLAVWIFARKIESPAQGFAMGLLSGAAFALIESLNASGDGTVSWPIIVSVRAGTSLLHMTASGLVGWGIVSAFRERRVLRFFGAYFSAVAIHGIWNACAVGAGLSMVGEFIDKPEWLFNIIPAALGGMSVLGIGMFAVLIASNRKLRNSPSSPSLPHRGKGDFPLPSGEG